MSIQNPITLNKTLPGRGTRFRPPGTKPMLICYHVQEGENDLYEYFKGVNADCTVWGRRDGTLWQLVPDNCTPWTNGNIATPNREIPLIVHMEDNGLNPNDFSLTIEHQGFYKTGFTKKQIDSTVRQSAYWCQRWNIQPDRQHLIMHSDLDSETRPNCPGKNFPLDDVIKRVAEMVNNDVNVWVPTQTGCEVNNEYKFLDFWRSNGGLAIFGYPISGAFYDPMLRLVVQWFERARFESHPTNPAAYQVELGQLGRELYKK